MRETIGKEIDKDADLNYKIILKGHTPMIYTPKEIPECN